MKEIHCRIISAKEITRPFIPGYGGRPPGKRRDSSDDGIPSAYSAPKPSVGHGKTEGRLALIPSPFMQLSDKARNSQSSVELDVILNYQNHFRPWFQLAEAQKTSAFLLAQRQSRMISNATSFYISEPLKCGCRYFAISPRGFDTSHQTLWAVRNNRQKPGQMG